MALFRDRADAGRRLAAELEARPGMVVYGIPRGGVVVAAAVAQALDIALDAVAVRKLGAPGNLEFALGAVADDVLVLNPDAVQLTGASQTELQFTQDMERAELGRRSALFRALRHDPAGREALVVDDGVATGATATAACAALRQHGATRVTLAVPVAPAGWAPEEGSVDEFVCPYPREDFAAVGQFYDEFTQTGDDEVIRLLAVDR